MRPCGAFLAGFTVLSTGSIARAQVVASAQDVVARALVANRELKAARLDVDRSRARLRQAGLRPNPTLDLERTTGRLTGSPEERDLSLGVALPLELAGERSRRIDLAEAELAATEAEVVDRERRLGAEALAAYADVLAAQRELKIIGEVEALDAQTIRVVEVRVEQHDAAPLELDLLRTEAQRLRARRMLAEGRLSAALVGLNTLIGAAGESAVTEVEPLTARSLETSQSATTLEAAMTSALERRPDLRRARLDEATAGAGLRLARAEAFPVVTLSAGFTSSRRLNDLPGPLLPVAQRDRILRFGVSVGLPFLNAKQGARAEAAVIIRQTQLRREFIEQTVRAEVTSAWRRLESARAAVAIFEHGVVDQLSENIRVVRAAYELGEFRISDLINEQRRLLEAQREYTDALIEGYRALIDLSAAAGTPTEARP